MRFHHSAIAAILVVGAFVALAIVMAEPERVKNSFPASLREAEAPVHISAAPLSDPVDEAEDRATLTDETVAAIRAGWVLDGVTKSINYVSETEVEEAWFRNNPSPFRVGDRLPNTQFSIREIVWDRVEKTAEGWQVRSGIELVSDSGEFMTIWLEEA